MSVLVERSIVFECAGDRCLGIIHTTQSRGSGIGVLVVVGGPQYRVGSHRQFVLLARQLATAGHPVMRFDYRGMGDSSGGQRDFREVAEDIRSAISAFLAAVPDVGTVVLFGLCDAASAIMMYGSSDERVGGLILANPWVRTEAGLARAHVKHYYGSRLLQASFWRKLVSGRLQVKSAVGKLFRSVSLAAQSGEKSPDRAQGTDFISAMRVGLAAFDRQVLLLNSGRDLTAREFSDLCQTQVEWGRLVKRENVGIETLSDADHTFSTRADSERAGAVCVRWLATLGS